MKITIAAMMKVAMKKARKVLIHRIIKIRMIMTRKVIKIMDALMISKLAQMGLVGSIIEVKRYNQK